MKKINVLLLSAAFLGMIQSSPVFSMEHEEKSNPGIAVVPEVDAGKTPEELYESFFSYLKKEEDYPKGVACLRQAGERGSSQACQILYDLYSAGRCGLPRDEVLGEAWKKGYEAVKEHEQKVNGKNPKDLCQLFELYADVENKDRAMKFLHEAADCGSYEACMYLSMFYGRGMSKFGIRQNSTTADMYTAKAEELKKTQTQ